MRYRLFLFALGLVFLLSSTVQTMTLRAPELFGGGHLYYVQASGRMIGVSDGWGWWLFHARRDGKIMDCRLVKLTSGGAVDADTVPCFGRFTDTARFVGWIDFRGHHRPFCGADGIENLPATCRSE